MLNKMKFSTECGFLSILYVYRAENVMIVPRIFQCLALYYLCLLSGPSQYPYPGTSAPGPPQYGGYGTGMSNPDMPYNPNPGKFV